MTGGQAAALEAGAEAARRRRAGGHPEGWSRGGEAEAGKRSGDETTIDQSRR